MAEPLCPARHWEPGWHTPEDCTREQGHDDAHRDRLGREWDVLEVRGGRIEVSLTPAAPGPGWEWPDER